MTGPEEDEYLEEVNTGFALDEDGCYDGCRPEEEEDE